MTDHRHSTHVDGCYRCELSRDEVEIDHDAMREAVVNDLSELERQLAVANARADAAEADRDRHHTTLTTLLDTIGDPYYLMADAAEVSLHHTRVADRLRRIADAAAAAAATQHHTPT